MTSFEPEELRRFLQPGTTSGRTPEQRACADVSEMFAREAVLALRQYEQSLDEGSQAARQVAARFGELWHGAGLDQVDWSHGTPSDAQRILIAAAELADAPERSLSVRAATERAHEAAPVGDTAARVQTDVDTAYGSAFTAPEPSVWLQQSLGRLARSRILQDVAGLGTRVEPTPELVAAGRDVTDRALAYADQRRATDRTALAAGRAGASRDRWLGAWSTFHVGATAYGAGGGQWPITISTTISMLMTTVLAQRGRAAITANERLAESQRAMTGQRDAVAGAVDRVPRPERRDTGRGR